jgi:uncharacterized protein YggE
MPQLKQMLSKHNKNMKQTTIILSFLLSAFSITLNGQGILESEIPYIEVTGTAELDIIPDQIYLEMTLKEDYKGKDKITISEQEEELKKALIKIGIDITNLSLTDANADYVRVRWSKKDILTKRDYTLIVSNAKILVKVLQELDKLDINEAHITKVNHSKIDSLKREVRISAIKAAKEKSDYLLNAIGEETGKPLIISETPTPAYSNVNRSMRSSRSETEQYFTERQKLKSDIQFQKLKLRTSIYIKFSIKE